MTCDETLVSDEEYRQAVTDDEHLRLLAIGFKVSAGMTLLYSMFAVFYVLMGASLMVTSEAVLAGSSVTGILFITMGLMFMLLSLAVAALRWRAAQCIQARRSRLFCQIVAGLACIEVPWGTLLGVSALVTLNRRSVATLFTDR